MDFDILGQTANLGGNAPVQGDGEFDGHPWYFRARHSHWELAVADPDGDPVQVAFGSQPGWYHLAEYGTGPFDASWMPLEEAAEFIREALARWRVGHLERRNDP